MLTKNMAEDTLKNRSMAYFCNSVAVEPIFIHEKVNQPLEAKKQEKIGNLYQSTKEKVYN